MNLRLRTNLNSENEEDKFLRIKLEQKFDFLEVLSLKISQEDVYRKFAADYGVLVGRVIANRGFGVPNAKVSIFIPLEDNEDNTDLIGRYPYRDTTDTNIDGIRYNLLPDSKQSPCHNPVGTFPSKRKILDNDVWLEIYDKYLKFTTTTNDSGDYMLFGIPLGTQKVHMDVDLSDIGFLSIKPFDLIAQGFNSEYFDSNTTFKDGTDLDSLVQIQSRDSNVNILPFWGDLEENEVGINRLDINLNIDITPTAQFFGSIFTEESNKGLYKSCTPRAKAGRNCQLKSGEGTVEYIRRISEFSDEVEYVNNSQTQIDENGNWVFSVPLNLKRVVTDEFGNLIPSEDPTVGVATEAKVRFRISLSEDRFGFKQRTANYLVPNMYNRFDFDSDTNEDDFYTMRWKKVYTVTNYIPRYQKPNIASDESRYFTGIKRIGDCENTSPFPYNRIDANVNVLYDVLCIVITAIGSILDIFNTIITAIVFGVVLKFTCFLKHPFNSAQRSACRCQACFNLANPSGSQDIPLFWDSTPPDADSNGNSISDSLECSTCYDGNGDSTFGFIVGANLVGNIAVNTGDATDGVYNINPFSTTGSGDDALFQVTVALGSVTQILVVEGGAGWKNGDQFTISTSQIGGTTNVIVNVTTSVLTTMITVGGITIDCSDTAFDINICKGLCQECDISIVNLNCNGINFENGNDWADCVIQNLAEDLNVINYEFYNDWVIGSLYSFLLDYKLRLKKNGKEFEKFCDYECREVMGTPSDDEHFKNRCNPARIIDKREFNNGNALKYEINGSEGRGLIVEYNNFLYYTSRSDVEVNSNNPPDLTVNEKSRLLFATNIIELGSSITCDLDGEPYLIDSLVATSYNEDLGVRTLFNVTNCGFPILNNVNQNGIQIISQTGVDILVSETERLGSIIGSDDDENYLIVGNEANLPDKDPTANHAIIILDRDDTILRRTLCENFNYYNTTGVYNTISNPVGGDYLEDIDGDIVESTTDVCQGYDDLRNDVNLFSSDNMPPYYMYFGVSTGKTALDKLKATYYDKCID